MTVSISHQHVMLCSLIWALWLTSFCHQHFIYRFDTESLMCGLVTVMLDLTLRQAHRHTHDVLYYVTHAPLPSVPNVTRFVSGEVSLESANGGLGH